MEFRTQQAHCADCHTPLNVLKTRTRKVVTLHLGAFNARESMGFCKTCGKTYGAEELGRLVSPASNFGYDVVVYVGKALFLQHRNGQEIVSELSAKNVRMSQSEVYVLGRKFIALLAMAHRESAARIKQAMSLKGGYMLHLDGTFEERGPLLMTGMDSMTEIVLGNIKLPSEKAEEIIPFLQNIKSLFGAPIALVHDMGRGILNAVQTVFEGIPDFICHYHFLRDLGNDLLKEDYDIIRKRLRKHGLTSKLRYREKTLKKLSTKTPDWRQPCAQLLSTGNSRKRISNSFPRSTHTALSSGPWKERTKVTDTDFPLTVHTWTSPTDSSFFSKTSSNLAPSNCAATGATTNPTTRFDAI